MSQKSQNIKTFVETQRAQGIPDAKIRRTLTEARLSPEAIEAAMMHELLLPAVAGGPYFPVHRWTNPFHVWVHGNKRITLMIVAVLALLVAATSAWTYHVRHRPVPRTTAAQTPVVDPNYALQLPVGWHRTPDFKPGAGLNVLYSADGTDTLAVYVTPITDPSMTSANHVATKIRELNQNGATAQQLSSIDVLYGPTKGKLTAVLGRAARDPNITTCYLFANVDFGKVAYDLDLTGNATDCSGTKLRSLSLALGTLVPKNGDLEHQVH